MPEGLFVIYGAENQPFTVLDAAPEGVDVALEQALETEAIHDIARNLATEFMGKTGASMVAEALRLWSTALACLRHPAKAG